MYVNTFLGVDINNFFAEGFDISFEPGEIKDEGLCVIAGVDADPFIPQRGIKQDGDAASGIVYDAEGAYHPRTLTQQLFKPCVGCEAKARAAYGAGETPQVGVLFGGQHEDIKGALVPGGQEKILADAGAEIEAKLIAIEGMLDRRMVVKLVPDAQSAETGDYFFCLHCLSPYGDKGHRGPYKGV